MAGWGWVSAGGAGRGGSRGVAGAPGQGVGSCYRSSCCRLFGSLLSAATSVFVGAAPVLFLFRLLLFPYGGGCGRCLSGLQLLPVYKSFGAWLDIQSSSNSRSVKLLGAYKNQDGRIQGEVPLGPALGPALAPTLGPPARPWQLALARNDLHALHLHWKCFKCRK